MKAATETLDSVIVERPLKKQNLCLDKGYGLLYEGHLHYRHHHIYCHASQKLKGTDLGKTECLLLILSRD